MDLFSESTDVIRASLGLMEILHLDGTSEFTYTVGIKCTADHARTIEQVIKVLQNVPTGRWDISIVPFTNEYLPADAIIFFDTRRKRTRNMLQYLNYFLIAAFLFMFIVESIVVDRWRVRIVYADTWLTGVLMVLFFALLLVSLKNWKSVVGKIGVVIAVASLVLHYGADFYYNGF